MKMREWQGLLLAQARLGKTLFTLTELANLSGTPRPVVTVEMGRLVKYGIVIRHVKGIYGLAEQAVPMEQLLSCIDPLAYITGAYALMRHGLATQVPTVATCFTTHRHFKREMETPAGRFQLVCVKPPVFRDTPSGLAGAEQALCDFVYLALRRGQKPAGLLTFRGLDRLNQARLNRIVTRYPGTVRRQLTMLLDSSAPHWGV